MNNRVLWLCVAAGWAMIAFGVLGVLGEGGDVPVWSFARWIVGLAVVNDLVVIPAVLATVELGRRAIPLRARTAAAAALVIAAPVALYAWPFATGWGRSSNQSVLPRDYLRGLITALAAVAAVALLLFVCSAVTSRRRRRARGHLPQDSPHV